MKTKDTEVLGKQRAKPSKIRKRYASSQHSLMETHRDANGIRVINEVNI